jgi:hypothetical protein
MTSTYSLAATAASFLAGAVGGIVSGHVGAAIGFATVGVIAMTGYLIGLSVKAAEQTRAVASSKPAKRNH